MFNDKFKHFWTFLWRHTKYVKKFKSSPPPKCTNNFYKYNVNINMYYITTESFISSEHSLAVLIRYNYSMLISNKWCRWRISKFSVRWCFLFLNVCLKYLCIINNKKLETCDKCRKKKTRLTENRWQFEWHAFWIAYRDNLRDYVDLVLLIIWVCTMVILC